MEQLPRLQARLFNLQELRNLIKALRVLAASHVQEAQAALAGIRRYLDVIEEAVVESVTLLPKMDNRVILGSPVGGSVLIVICSEHGFVGGLNERLLDRAVASRKAGQKIVIIGHRGAMLAADKDLEIDNRHAMATHVGGVLGVARRVAGSLASVPAADIVFASYRKGGAFEVESRTILPLDPVLLIRSRQRNPPLHHLMPETLLQRLASEYLFAEITHAIMESLASENGARLRVMESADHNIGDKLEEMRRLENTLRQEAITSELLDVVTGAEAILARALNQAG